jgi:hypothetical protein
MFLSSLLRALPAYQIENQRDAEITAITADSPCHVLFGRHLW